MDYHNAQQVAKLIDIVGNARAFLIVALSEETDEEGSSYVYYCSDQSVEAGFIEYAAIMHQQHMEDLTRGGKPNSRDEQ